MCSGLNFTKIKLKNKELLTSIFTRVDSIIGRAPSTVIAGAGTRGEAIQVSTENLKKKK